MTIISLVDTMGDDLTVCNAARVSFNKESGWDTVGPFAEEIDAQAAKAQDVQARPGDDSLWQGGAGWVYQRLNDKDAKLIHSLAREGHWSPFSHAIAQFRMKMPLAIARQWYKHRIGIEKDCGWNEVSRRYVVDMPEFYMPSGWRKRPTGGAKQGSSDELVETIFGGKPINNLVAAHYESARRLYEEMITEGVAPEMARLVLPNATMTEWVETGSVMAYARLVNLRIDPHAQKDIKPYAAFVFETLGARFPTAWRALMGVKP
jgi:thymidylate synthase (FAD)